MNFWKILQEIQEFLVEIQEEYRSFWVEIQEENRKFSIFGSKHRKNIGSLVDKIQQKSHNMEKCYAFYIMQNSLIVQQLLTAHRTRLQFEVLWTPTIVHISIMDPNHRPYQRYGPQPSFILALWTPTIVHISVMDPNHHPYQHYGPNHHPYQRYEPQPSSILALWTPTIVHISVMNPNHRPYQRYGPQPSSILAASQHKLEVYLNFYFLFSPNTQEYIGTFPKYTNLQEGVKIQEIIGKHRNAGYPTFMS